MATIQEIAIKLEEKVKTVKNFKIGKTGQTLEERYNQDYCNTYTNRQIVCKSDKKESIDNAEKFLIDYLIERGHNHNDQIGGGEMKDSTQYIVYLVYNEL